MVDTGICLCVLGGGHALACCEFYFTPALQHSQYELLVAGVLLVQQLRVVFQNKVVLFCMAKQHWYERILNFVEGRHLPTEVQERVTQARELAFQLQT